MDWTLWKGTYRPGAGFGFSASHRPARRLCAEGALKAELCRLQAEAACSGSATRGRRLEAGDPRVNALECTKNPVVCARHA